LRGDCTVDRLAGFAIDEGEAEMGRTLAQTTNDTLAVLGVVRGGPRIAVDQTLLERPVDEDRDLAGRRGDRSGLAHLEVQAARLSTSFYIWTESPTFAFSNKLELPSRAP